jgi:DNA helicase HerA-like ATPase
VRYTAPMSNQGAGLRIGRGASELALWPSMANRHGLIAGATGTGKTVTLRVLAEQFSRAGVPVFMADVKGDLSGIARAGTTNPKIEDRLKKVQPLEGFAFAGAPTIFWDVLGEQGHPLRTTISEMGPLLFARLLNLNDTQAGVLTLAFKVADDQGLLLLDLKDMRALLAHVSDHASELRAQYGNVSPASVGTIQRALLELEQQGAEKFFTEPALSIDDLMQTDAQGHGVINLLAADKLMGMPKLYTTFLLYLMAELFEQLPEVGDLEKPKLVFFFDEAHLLFTDAPKALRERIEQVVRLIRSKGVGIYFVTQNPLDIPDSVLGQLGNRVQHALRAFTPKDQKTIKAVAETFRPNPAVPVEQVISELSVGEALVSLLDESGVPAPVDRALIDPPRSQLPPLTAAERTALIRQSVIFGHYEQTIDRESAYERLNAKASAAPRDAGRNPGDGGTVGDNYGQPAGDPSVPPPEHGGGAMDGLGKVFSSFAQNAARAAGSQLGRQVIRGIFASMLGGTAPRRRRR